MRTSSLRKGERILQSTSESRIRISYLLLPTAPPPYLSPQAGEGREGEARPQGGAHRPSGLIIIRPEATVQRIGCRLQPASSATPLTRYPQTVGAGRMWYEESGLVQVSRIGSRMRANDRRELLKV